MPFNPSEDINDATFERWLKESDAPDAIKKEIKAAFQKGGKAREDAVRELMIIRGGKSVPGKKPGSIPRTKKH